MKRANRIFGILAALACAAPADAYYANGRWTTTASGAVGPLGSPVTLTWSIVPDGTLFQGTAFSSNLVSTLDFWFGAGTGGGDLEKRPWFSRFVQCFDRWSELSGVSFVYEPVDDRANHGSPEGVVGTRGDIRFAGRSIDGNGGSYASAWFIPNADVTIDTGDILHYTDTSGNFRNFRNTVTHEIGHALGLGHITATNAHWLMEPLFTDDYDGPQWDDIRGVQYQYGDVHEQGAGNDTIVTATEMTSMAVGTHGNTGNEVAPSELDFVSISNADDIDFYSFQLDAPALVDIILTPVGTTYDNKIGVDAATTINSKAISDLSLELYSFAGGVSIRLGSANSLPAGGTESLLDIELPTNGPYFLKVTGSANDVQLYTLAVSTELLDPGPSGDFDNDGDVDGADFLVWQRGGTLEPLSPDDLAAWQLNYGVPGPLATAVPEPTFWWSLWVAGLVARVRAHARPYP
jgi:serralysin